MRERRELQTDSRNGMFVSRHIGEQLQSGIAPLFSGTHQHKMVPNF